MSCVVCGRRKGKRACPARGGGIWDFVDQIISPFCTPEDQRDTLTQLGIDFGDTTGFEALPGECHVVAVSENGKINVNDPLSLDGDRARNNVATQLFTLTGGFLFATFPGALFNIVAATVGATAIFLAAQTSIGARLGARLEGSEGVVKRIKEGIDENQWSMLFLIRLVPVVPFFVANLVPAFMGAHAVPSSRTTMISAFGIALPIDSGRFSTSCGGRKVERKASVRPYIK